MKPLPKGMAIVQIEDAREIPLALLLKADPSEKNIVQYLSSAIAFAAILDKEILACCIILYLDEQQAEIKNISVHTPWQGKGIAQHLLVVCAAHCSKNGLNTLKIATGNSSIKQLYLYQKMGFRICGVVKDYFLKNYEEEIWENGLQCLDQVIFIKDLRVN